MDPLGSVKRSFTALVFFQGCDRRSAWKIFTSPRCRHCWVVLPVYFPKPGLMATRWSMTIEATGWGIVADLHYADPFEAAQEFYDRGGFSVIEIDIVTPPKRLISFGGLRSCVSVSKSILAMRAWWVLTPRAFRAYLLRSGGREIIPNVRNCPAVPPESSRAVEGPEGASGDAGSGREQGSDRAVPGPPVEGSS